MQLDAFDGGPGGGRDAEPLDEGVDLLLRSLELSGRRRRRR